MDKKIIITGGHLTPALATLHELQAQGFKRLVWIGTRYAQTQNKNISAEYKIISKEPITSYFIKAGKIWRKVTLKTLTKAIYNLFLIPSGIVASYDIIRKEKPDLIVSFGGYLALAVVVAAKLNRVKVITHEQTLTVGLANKYITRLADKILISWKQSAANFPATKVVYTGNPVRKEAVTVTTDNYKFNNKLPVITAIGGNQGSNTINWRLLQILPDILEEVNLIHITGNSTLTRDFVLASSYRKTFPASLQSRYIVKEAIFGEEIGEVFAMTDLFISRSGANTINEQLTLGKRAILIPIPWSSQNEQLKNAKILESCGLGTILEQHDKLKPSELLAKIKLGLEAVQKKQDFQGRKISEAQAEAKKLINPEATKAITAEIKKFVS